MYREITAEQKTYNR